MTMVAESLRFETNVFGGIVDTSQTSEVKRVKYVYESNIHGYRDLETGRFTKREVAELYLLEPEVKRAGFLNKIKALKSGVTSWWQKTKEEIGSFYLETPKPLKLAAKLNLSLVFALLLDRGINQYDPTVYASDQMIQPFIGDNGSGLCIFSDLNYFINSEGKTDAEYQAEVRLATQRYLTITGLLTNASGPDCNRISVKNYQDLRELSQVSFADQARFNLLAGRINGTRG